MLSFVHVSHGKVKTPLGRLDHGLGHMQARKGAMHRSFLSIYSCFLLPPLSSSSSPPSSHTSTTSKNISKVHASYNHFLLPHTHTYKPTVKMFGFGKPSPPPPHEYSPSTHTPEAFLHAHD